MSYIPNTDEDRKSMLATIGVESIDDLFNSLPVASRLKGSLNIPGRFDQVSLIKHFRSLSKTNINADDIPCFMGAGIYDHYVPPTIGAIIGRSEFYTSYTPYQPELSQGTLQSIFEFQTLICKLFGMDVANASMYDGATALAEAVIMAADVTGRRTVVIPDTVNPMYREVVATYASHNNVTIRTISTESGVISGDVLRAELSEDCAALVIQQPNFYGNFEDALAARDASTASGSLLIACVDPISLGVTAPPGEYDADIAVAEGQSLGCPMGFGGPLLGLFACKERFMRRLPGRIVGQTLDASNKRAFVMTLRTREQDIRRERATSNICTNEALYALAATVYLATMGPKGMEQVGHLCLQKARYAAEQIGNVDGFNLVFPSKWTFKEFLVSVPGEAIKLSEFLLLRGVLGGFVTAALVPEFGETMLFCVTENRTRSEIDLLVALLAEYSAEVSRDGGLPQ